VDIYLGVRLFSKRAFAKCFGVSTCILGLLLGVTGILNGRAIGVAPWEAYQKATSQLDQVWSKLQSLPKMKEEQEQQQAIKDLREIVM
jgi:hypothetical protein